MKPRDIINHLVDTYVVPLTKPAGFKKTRFTFYRHHHDVVQVINFQLSAFNDSYQGSFFLNIGLNFDQISELTREPIIYTPKEYECQFHRRAEDLLPNTPGIWSVKTEEENPLCATHLVDTCNQLIEQLDQIEEIKAILKHNWFMQSWALRAQANFLLGNQMAAISTVQELINMCVNNTRWNLDNWLEQVGLSPLKPFLTEVDPKPSPFSYICITDTDREALSTISAILRKIVIPARLFYRPTKAYVAILLDDNKNKWICRVAIGKNQMNLYIPDGAKKPVRYSITSLDDIYAYQDQLIEATKCYIKE